MTITGALHEDGLADAADGFGGGTAPDRVLAIMKDSRIGTYGAVALILVIVAKLATLASLTPLDALRALVVAHTLARWSSVALLWRYPYVSSAAGTSAASKGAAFSDVGTMRLAIASAIAVAVAAGVMQFRAIGPVLVAVIVTAMAGFYFRRRIGGVTGDCLGAANQLVELATYATVAAVWVK